MLVPKAPLIMRLTVYSLSPIWSWYTTSHEESLGSFTNSLLQYIYAPQSFWYMASFFVASRRMNTLHLFSPHTDSQYSILQFPPCILELAAQHETRPRGKLL